MNFIPIVAMPMADRFGWDMGLAGVSDAGFGDRAAFLRLRRPSAWVSRQIRRLCLSPDMRRLSGHRGVRRTGGGVVQVNLLVGRQVGSPGRSDRLVDQCRPALPVAAGRRRHAIGIVLLPDIARRLKAGDTDGGRHAYNRATELRCS